jgi:hypothetical protein
VLAAAVGIVAAIALAAPAQAVDTDRYVKNVGSGQWVFATSVPSRSATTSVCCSRINSWKFEPRSTSPSGHTLAKFQSNWNNGCLDSHASVSAVWIVACNTGDYQLWEIFANSNGTQTFKSWGAFRHQGAHVCMGALSGNGNLSMFTCNTADGHQQWRNASS